MYTGYDPSFLSVAVPLPDALRPSVTLDYPRFSVVLADDRRFAAVTGVNIDGRSWKVYDRAGNWHFDHRIDKAAQAGPSVYTGGKLDRGHQVRRADPGWGDADDAVEAERATFVYTNAVPQAKVFNESPELWRGLEDHVLTYADAQDLLVSVFTAPILDPADPPYRDVLLPLRFWKIAAWVNPGVGLAAAGFVLDQTDLIDVSDGLLSVPPLGPYKTYQVPIADIVAHARIDLGPLVAADVRPSSGLLGGEQWTLLTSPDDIVLRPE